MRRAGEGIAAPWIVGVEIELKKMKKIRGRTRSADNVADVPRQWLQKACWYFVTSRINPQAHGYRYTFHPRVFLGIVSTEEREYTIYDLGSSKDTHTDRNKRVERVS